MPGAPWAPAGSTLLSAPGVHTAIVRFSRSIGAPRPLPDLLGMSLRVLDAYGPDRHQDFLLVTCGARPLLHHVHVAIVTAAYMIRRGLAKSGSREPYWDGAANQMRDRDGR